ncbi:hypothetical protein B0H16DRAFT_892301 [Mycena metata]|uniref:Uncharacterized protein n=1 Tax=Mycena metata TaxID=1033252 RepID=A0AAD7IU84_9AGAR|nr:hypothetical protein B0H16DRAFT_892301 [Mycena metata]
MPTVAITDGWVLVYVSERLLSPKFITLAMSRRRVSTPSLPLELWTYIHRLALSNLSPLAKIYASDDTIIDIRSGVKSDNHAANVRDLQLFLKAALSLRCVCRLWSELGLELLFENICINDSGWPSLSSSLQHPNVARLVRSIRLSTTRFDYNVDVLSRCLHVEVLVQPEFPRTERLNSGATVQLPPLQSLKRLYWVVSAWSSALLQSVLFAAPNLEHISFSGTPTIVFDPATQPTLPDLPRLNSLALITPDTGCVLAILRADLSRLTHLTINPAYLASNIFPVLPALQMLTLLEYSSHLSFPGIFARCPALRELRYNALRQYIPPEERQRAPFLTCIRLFLQRQMPPTQAQAQVALLLRPAFSALERVMLDGPGWGPPPSPAAMWPGTADLLARGCRIEKGVE